MGEYRPSPGLITNCQSNALLVERLGAGCSSSREFKLLIEDNNFHGLALDAVNRHGVRGRLRIHDSHQRVQVLRICKHGDLVSCNRVVHGVANLHAAKQIAVRAEPGFPLYGVLNLSGDDYFGHVGVLQ